MTHQEKKDERNPPPSGLQFLRPYLEAKNIKKVSNVGKGRKKTRRKMDRKQKQIRKDVGNSGRGEN